MIRTWSGCCYQGSVETVPSLSSCRASGSPWVTGQDLATILGTWPYPLKGIFSYDSKPITYFSGVAWTGLGICMRRSDWLTPPLALEKLRQHHASDTPSVKRWCRRPVWMQREPERAHTHVTHRMRVRTQITWTWLCTRGKKRYKYCSFSHTNRSFRVLGHQCVVTMGNCLIWISLCMFFFPLIETVTYTCHYMTNRLERFDLKTSKLDLLKMPLG